MGIYRLEIELSSYHEGVWNHPQPGVPWICYVAIDDTIDIDKLCAFPQGEDAVKAHQVKESILRALLASDYRPWEYDDFNRFAIDRWELESASLPRRTDAQSFYFLVPNGSQYDLVDRVGFEKSTA